MISDQDFRSLEVRDMLKLNQELIARENPWWHLICPYVEVITVSAVGLQLKVYVRIFYTSEFYPEGRSEPEYLSPQRYILNKVERLGP